jgi:hypothetical protein
MTDRFESAWQKLDRARKHADDLEAELSAFWATDPFEVEPVGTLATGRGAHRVTRIEALPVGIPLIAGDAVHNIRSALDHFACSVVPCPDRATAFPVWSTSKATTPTAGQWRKEVERRAREASPRLVEALVRLEVWEAGRDSLLWAIHELDRVDKHRLLLTIAVVNTGIQLHGDDYVLATVRRFGGYAQDQPLVIEPIKWIPLRQGTILFDVQNGLGLNATETHFTFDVTLGEPEVLTHQSAVVQLRILADLAESVIRQLASLV